MGTVCAFLGRDTDQNELEQGGYTRLDVINNAQFPEDRLTKAKLEELEQWFNKHHNPTGPPPPHIINYLKDNAILSNPTV